MQMLPTRGIGGGKIAQVRAFEGLRVMRESGPFGGG